MVLPPAARKPQGGFVLISVVQLCMAWWAYRAGRIRLIDLRVWFATHELVARRCLLRPGQQPRYTCEELHHLVGGGGGIPASLQRLTAAGLICWAATTISFPAAPAPEQECARLAAMLAQIRNHHRLVPVPRRLLRFVAGGCRRSLIATLLGHLFRCLYYSQGQCQPYGLCKASWIAEVFGVSVRCVKTARHELETLTLLQRIDVPQWVLNRYGPKMAINLQWELPPTWTPLSSVSLVVTNPTPVATHPDTYAAPPAQVAAQPTAAGLTPPAEFSTLTFAPPDSHKERPTGTEHQKPASGGPAGVLRALFERAWKAMREGTALLDDSGSVVLRTVSAPCQQNPPPAPENDPVSLPAPTLQNIVRQDLHDPGRLIALYEQAVQAGLIGASEAERLTFVALACHVLRYRPQNAGGLFHCLITRKLYHMVTQADEDAARHSIRRYLYGERAAPPHNPASHQNEDWLALERIGRKDTRMASSKDFRLARPAVVVRKRAAKPVVPAAQPPPPPIPRGPVQPTPAPVTATSTAPLLPPVTTHSAATVPLRSALAAPPPTPQRPPAATKPAAARVQPATPLPAPARPEAPLQPAPRPAEDPGSSAAQRQQRKQAIQAVLTVLMARWPQTFAAYPVPVRPLATGIDRDLAAALPAQSRRHIRFAITWWQRVRGPAYWQALLQGGPRYDLAGQPRGKVTPAQQERARQELAAWQERRGRAGRTARRSNTPDGPTPPPEGEQTVTHRTQEPLDKKE